SVVFSHADHVLLLFLFIFRPPPTSTLVPYTTLFRSFAFTGTGLFNLLSYPRLVGSEGSRGRVAYVVTLGTLVPAAAYVWWMLSVDRKSTRLNSSHGSISYAVFCLKKKR